MRATAFVCLWLGAMPAGALAAPVVETTDRLEVNWATHRLRFYGEAEVALTDQGDGFKTAEKRAWHDGLTYATEAVRNLNISANEAYVPNPEKLSEYAREAARQVSTSTFSYNTTYYGSGTVRVHLENVLPKALEPVGVRFRQKEAIQPAMTQHSGLVIATDRAMRPRSTYQVVDETGAVLFAITDMAEEAFRRNLMGRWFKRPTTAELSEVVGKQPLTVQAVVKDGGRLAVDKAAWEQALEGHRALLVNGTIAIALP